MPDSQLTVSSPGSSQSSDSATNTDVFIARQPIFTLNQDVFGYELLFRASQENRFSDTDGNTASFHTINNALHLTGLDTLTNGKKAFINFTRRLLTEKWYTLLPSDLVVVELLEDIVPDDQVIEACRAVKDAGFTLALDDVVTESGYDALFELADIVKIDFMLTTPDDRKPLVERCRKRNLQLLAEKVERTEEIEEAQSSGYAYLQGYFFAKPQMMRSRDVRTHKLSYLRFLDHINRSSIDYDQVEAIVKEDASLAYKLLRYMNCAAMGMRQKVASIQQALALLGESALRKWGSLVALTGLADGKPEELLTLCLIRAHFCESLAPALNMQNRETSLFMLGLLSGLSAVMDAPVREVLKDVPIEDDVRDSLLGKPTRIGSVYRLARACERGDWQRTQHCAETLSLSEAVVAQAYQNALKWADLTQHSMK